MPEDWCMVYNDMVMHCTFDKFAKKTYFSKIDILVHPEGKPPTLLAIIIIKDITPPPIVQAIAIYAMFTAAVRFRDFPSLLSMTAFPTTAGYMMCIHDDKKLKD